jgi:hypothetical protein
MPTAEPPEATAEPPEATAEPPEAGAEAVLQAADPSPAESQSADTPEPEPIEQDDLLSELARAMQAAAAARRLRMNSELESLRSEQVEAIAARASSEVDLLKAGSEADIGSIDAWATAEAERIRLERLRRIDARREQLASQLGRQESIRTREVIAVEVAIEGHRSEIDSFFGRIEHEVDPAAIARFAAVPPQLPPLAEIAAEARRSAAAEFANLDRQAASGQVTLKPAPDETGAGETGAGDTRPLTLIAAGAARGVDGNGAPWVSEPYAVTVAAGPPVVHEPEPASAPSAAAAPSTPSPQAEPPAGLGSTLLRTVRSIRPLAGRQDSESGDGDGQR